MTWENYFDSNRTFRNFVNQCGLMDTEEFGCSDSLPE